MDIKTTEERSKNMSKVKNANTNPELFIRSLLHKSGFRFRVNYKNITGKPDIYFTKKKVAIFVNGCFWHRHAGCKYASTPGTNVEFWQEKFAKNIERDKTVKEDLLNQGIRVLIIWECTVKKMRKDVIFFDYIYEIISSFIIEQEDYLEI